MLIIIRQSSSFEITISFIVIYVQVNYETIIDDYAEDEAKVEKCRSL